MSRSQEEATLVAIMDGDLDQARELLSRFRRAELRDFRNQLRDLCGMAHDELNYQRGMSDVPPSPFSRRQDP